MGRVLLSYFDAYHNLRGVTRRFGVQSCTWVRNDAGTATLTVPTSHPDLKAIIEWGNILKLRQWGLKTWVGQATTREWGPGYVALNCKSAEWMLGGKITSQGRVYGAGAAVSAGATAADLFRNAAVSNNDLRVFREGAFSASAKVFREYNYADLFETYKRLAEDSNADFWVDDALAVHFTDRRGADKRTSLVLRDSGKGAQLVDPRIVESAEEVATAIIGLGEGSTVAEKPKLLLKYPNSSFFRAYSLDVANAVSAELLDGPVRAELTKRAVPRVAIDTGVRRDQNGGFWGLEIGDYVTLVLNHPLWRNIQARVLGLELTDPNVLRMVLDVIQPVTPSAFVGFGVV